jgi:hypothetical protein
VVVVVVVVGAGVVRASPPSALSAAALAAFAAASARALAASMGLRSASSSLVFAAPLSWCVGMSAIGAHSHLVVSPVTIPCPHQWPAAHVASPRAWCVTVVLKLLPWWQRPRTVPVPVPSSSEIFEGSMEVPSAESASACWLPARATFSDELASALKVLAQLIGALGCAWL